MRVTCLLVFLLSCSRNPTVIPPATPAAQQEPAPEATTAEPAPAAQRPTAPAPAAPAPMYTLEEALADVSASPLTYVGTGDWTGIARIKACVYRNDRVFVVNVYCTLKEMPAFGMAVLSPTRGRVYFYAEAKKPISALRRGDYFTFLAEAEPAVVDANVPALELSFTYDQLRAWDAKRYKRFAPACSVGTELKKAQGSCVGDLKSQTDTWVGRNKPFVDAPPADWYKVVKEMRGRAQKDGKPVSRPGG